MDVLIVDDEDRVAAFLERAIKGAEPNWKVETRSNGTDALKLLENQPFHLAILDINLPDLTGLDVLKAMKQKFIRTEVILITGYATLDTAIEAVRLGARDFLRKPFKTSEFISKLRVAAGTIVDKERHISPHILADRLDEFVREHAGEPRLRLKDLHEHFRISRSYACRLFQKHVGATFRKRLSYYRVESAKKLISSSDLTLGAISADCGFKNQQRLRDAFVSLEGMPPSQYRKLCRHSR